MYLSNVFKFTQGLGQIGHQIGRKVGDAIELLTLGMIDKEIDLSRFLVIEDKIAGATAAEHKVEFSFYNIQNGIPSRQSMDLFGIIECKKVGVEQTKKQNFKEWESKPQNKVEFYRTSGYEFTINPNTGNFCWQILVAPSDSEINNLKIEVRRTNRDTQEQNTFNYLFACVDDSQVLIVVDSLNNLFILGPNQSLNEINNYINKCIIIQIKQVINGNVSKINVNESLPGPQTPEKAKQASFVSLDVRKNVLGRFDKSEDQSFISVLVIGEFSHWEEKSCLMIKLCNDYNLIIPDEVIVYLFIQFRNRFGLDYQEMITKTNYRNNPLVKGLVEEILTSFDDRILIDINNGNYVKFKHEIIEGRNRLIIR